MDGHFLSDTVNPTDMLRITQGAWLRLPPGRIGRWAVIRSISQAVPEYSRRLSESPAIILVPGGGTWNGSESVSLDYALLAAMPGMMGLSGDLTGLTAEQRARVAQAITCFKQWRRFIVGSAGHLLTPPELIDRREGWIGLPLQRPGDDDTSLVFVYRLGPADAPPALRLHGLDPKRRYTISDGFNPANPAVVATGERLANAGLPAEELALGNRQASVWVVRAECPAG